MLVLAVAARAAGYRGYTSASGSSELSSLFREDKKDAARRLAGQRKTAPPLRQGAAAGTTCSTDDACYGWCVQGVCADTQASAVEATPANACTTDEACPVGRSCRAFQCVEATCTRDEVCGAGKTCSDQHCISVMVPPKACATSGQCDAGQSCSHGRCLSSPPSPPDSLRRRGLELYLRTRVVEFREELALGTGPIVAQLSVRFEVSPQTLRAHRRELVDLIGDGTHATWPARVLERLTSGLTAAHVPQSALRSVP